jgi:hypothetical protein
MEAVINTKCVLVRKNYRRDYLGDMVYRRNNIKVELKEIGCYEVDWILQAQYRFQLHAPVKMIIKFCRFHRQGIS